MDALALQALEFALQAAESIPAFENRLYDSLLKWAMTTTGADEGGVLSVAENRANMRIEKWVGKGVEQKSRILSMALPPTTICARCAQTSQPQLIPDVRKDKLFLARSDTPIVSELAIPMRCGEEVIGVLNLESIKHDFFTEAQAALVQNFADEVAPLLKLATTALREQRLRKLLKSLETVSKSLLIEAPEITLERVLNETLLLTGATLGGVCLLSPDKDVLVVGPAKGLKPGLEGKPEIPKGKGFCWLSIEEEATQNIPNVLEHKNAFHDLSTGEIRSLLCAPLFVGEEPVGALNVESDEINHFSLLDEEILSLFTFQAGLAVKLLTQRERFAQRTRLLP